MGDKKRAANARPAQVTRPIKYGMSSSPGPGLYASKTAIKESGPGTLSSRQERQLLRQEAAGAMNLETGARARPDQLAARRHFIDFAAVRIDNERVAVRQPLRHPPQPAQESLAGVVGVRPGERLGLGVVLEHPRAASRAEIVEEQQMAVVEKRWIVLGMPGAARRPHDRIGLGIDHGDGVQVARRE